METGCYVLEGRMSNLQGVEGQQSSLAGKSLLGASETMGPSGYLANRRQPRRLHA